MEQVQLSVLANVLGSTAPVEASITEICTDTRTLQPGCLFLALKGASFDGHDFVERAIAAGAVSCNRAADCRLPLFGGCRYRACAAANCRLVSQSVSSYFGWCYGKCWKDYNQGNDCAGIGCQVSYTENSRQSE